MPVVSLLCTVTRHAQPPSAFATFRSRHDADPRTDAASAPRHGLLDSPRDRRGLLSGILESVGGVLGFGNEQAHPGDPKDTGNGGASSTGAREEATSVHFPSDKPSPPASYSAPGGGGGGQVDKPTPSAPMSVSPAPHSNYAAPAPYSTSPPDAMNVVPTPSTTPPAREAQPVSDVGVSTTAAPEWPSVSSAPSPTLTISDPISVPGRTGQLPAGSGSRARLRSRLGALLGRAAQAASCVPGGCERLPERSLYSRRFSGSQRERRGRQGRKSVHAPARREGGRPVRCCFPRAGEQCALDGFDAVCVGILRARFLLSLLSGL